MPATARSQAFLASRPPLAEAGGIARAVLAAAETGARVHVRQINSALGVATWRRLRDMADVSVETTPQNLFFTAADYETMGAGLKASPPLRQAEDVAALREALSARLIDMVATDHAPHSPAEKAAAYAAFADIPGGMPGLQTLLQTMLKLVDEGVIGLSDIARMCAANPAARFGLKGSKGRIAPGFDADILVLDMRRESVISHGRAGDESRLHAVRRLARRREPRARVPARARDRARWRSAWSRDRPGRARAAQLNKAAV